PLLAAVPNPTLSRCRQRLLPPHAAIRPASCPPPRVSGAHHSLHVQSTLGNPAHPPTQSPLEDHGGPDTACGAGGSPEDAATRGVVRVAAPPPMGGGGCTGSGGGSNPPGLARAPAAAARRWSGATLTGDALGRCAWGNALGGGAATALPDRPSGGTSGTQSAARGEVRNVSVVLLRVRSCVWAGRAAGGTLGGRCGPAGRRERGGGEGVHVAGAGVARRCGATNGDGEARYVLRVGRVGSRRRPFMRFDGWGSAHRASVPAVRPLTGDSRPAPTRAPCRKLDAQRGPGRARGRSGSWHPRSKHPKPLRPPPRPLPPPRRGHQVGGVGRSGGGGSRGEGGGFRAERRCRLPSAAASEGRTHLLARHWHEPVGPRSAVACRGAGGGGAPYRQPLPTQASSGARAQAKPPPKFAVIQKGGGPNPAPGRPGPVLVLGKKKKTLGNARPRDPVVAVSEPNNHPDCTHENLPGAWGGLLPRAAPAADSDGMCGLLLARTSSSTPAAHGSAWSAHPLSCKGVTHANERGPERGDAGRSHITNRLRLVRSVHPQDHPRPRGGYPGRQRAGSGHKEASTGPPPSW
ncbi:hypothetical protein BU14_0176s0031, partial [Porphyra umbilicalis]